MPFLLILATALLLYFLYKNKRPPHGRRAVKPSRTQYQPDAPLQAPACHWQDGGRYETEVVAESAYQNTIRQLAGAHGDDNAKTAHTAILLPDDAYPYDDKAVAVFVEGRVVGYLAREDARRLRRKLERKELAGQPTSCASEIRGGALWQGKRLAYVVALDLEPFD